MMSDNKEQDSAERTKRPLHRVRLPGFLIDEPEDVGLGDVVKRAASAVGIKPCGGCARRAAALNRWIGISGRRSP